MHKPSLFLTLLLIAGCAATPYQAADQKGYGYQDQQIGADLYEVMYVSNTATDSKQVDDFALLRAAEIGASLGYAYLSVTDTRTGTVVLGTGASGHISNSAYAGYMQPQMGRTGSGMDSGSGGSYAGTGNNLLSLASSKGGGDPARACVLRVRFYKQDAAAGPSAQDIPALVTRLRAAYGLPAPASGH